MPLLPVRQWDLVRVAEDSVLLHTTVARGSVARGSHGLTHTAAYALAHVQHTLPAREVVGDLQTALGHAVPHFGGCVGAPFG